MNTTDVQHMLMDTIRGLFQEPARAQAYANDPRAYLDEKLGEYDMRGVDLPAAVNDAVDQAKLPQETASETCPKCTLVQFDEGCFRYCPYSPSYRGYYLVFSLWLRAEVGEGPGWRRQAPSARLEPATVARRKAQSG